MSKSKIKSMNFSIYEFMKKHKNTMSFEHRHGMTRRLTAMGAELHKLGYEPTHIGRIKQKHIEILVKHWQEKGIAVSTIKNRMSDLRFVCRGFHRSNVVLNNDDYGIGKRSYVPTENKAIVNADFKSIQDQHLKISLELQKAFGLRREECIKIIPSMADRGDTLWLKGSWTKGGIERAIPISTTEQRYWLDQAKKLTNNQKSLIPEDKSYIQQRHLYDRETHDCGLKNLHGLRHAYAQQRYKEITGWESPINGGKIHKEMTTQERSIDREARTVVAKELGHSRVAIAKNYLG